jgi:hypothetical protein
MVSLYLRAAYEYHCLTFGEPRAFALLVAGLKASGIKVHILAPAQPDTFGAILQRALYFAGAVETSPPVDNRQDAV